MSLSLQKEGETEGEEYKQIIEDNGGDLTRKSKTRGAPNMNKKEIAT